MISAEYWVLVISCPWSLILMLFVHPLSSFSDLHGTSGALQVRLWEFIFYLFLCIQWILFASWLFVRWYYLLLILMLFLHPFGSVSFSGLCRRTSFSDKTITEKSVVPFLFFRDCFVVVGASQKLLRAQRLYEKPNFWKAPLSNASLESALDAWK